MKKSLRLTQGPRIKPLDIPTIPGMPSVLHTAAAQL